MAEKAEKKPEAAPAHGAEKKAGGGSLMSKTPILLGGAMIIEAVVLFAGFKFLGGGAPKPAQAEIAGAAEGKAGEGGAAGPTTQPDKKKPVEIPVVDFRALNRRGGHTFLYEVTIVAVTHQEFEEEVKNIVNERGNLIRDRIRTIIAQNDPEKLGGGSEPGLETLRRQVKFQLDEIIGKDLIDEVLVPKCIPYRTDY